MRVSLACIQIRADGDNRELGNAARKRLCALDAATAEGLSAAATPLGLYPRMSFKTARATALGKLERRVSEKMRSFVVATRVPAAEMGDGAAPTP